MSELAFNRFILQKHNQILAILVIISLVLNVVLAWASIVFANQKPIIVSSSSGELSLLDQKEYRLNEDMLKGFSMMIATHYLNFTSETLQKQITNIANYLDAQPVESILNSYKKNENKMVDKQVIHSFTIDSVDVTKKSNPFVVEVSGKRVISVGSSKRVIDTSYLFEVAKFKPQADNPYGLIVKQIVEKKKEDKK